MGLLLAPFTAPATEKRADGPVVVIPIHGMIERGLVYMVRRGVNEAIRENARAIIVDMDTPGGQVQAAEDIAQQFAGAGIPVYTYVNPSAISAGAIIAMGTDYIYMAPGSRIGDAAPIMMSPLGTAEEMGKTQEEKALSYVAGLIRALAQRKGHDAKLAEAMVRKEAGYKAGDEVIHPAGSLLTLTNVEAERPVTGTNGVPHPLLSCGTAETLEKLIQTLGMAGAPRKDIKPQPSEAAARYIEIFSFLFLAGGLLGLYIEFKTPGFGLPGIAGIILLAIWFWGYHVAGLAGMGEIILFVIGVSLLIAEVFLIPGFGIFGVAGIVCIFSALLMAMVEHYPGGGWMPPPAQLQGAVVQLGFTLAGVVLIALLLVRWLPKTTIYRNLVLTTDEKGSQGYQPGPLENTLVGLRGIAGSQLRPAGIGEFGEKRLDVVTRGDFIEKGKSIVIVETGANRILVELAPNNTAKT